MATSITFANAVTEDIEWQILLTASSLTSDDKTVIDSFIIRFFPNHRQTYENFSGYLIEGRESSAVSKIGNT
jgi:hypothetical protein